MPEFNDIVLDISSLTSAEFFVHGFRILGLCYLQALTIHYQFVPEFNDIVLDISSLTSAEFFLHGFRNFRNFFMVAIVHTVVWSVRGKVNTKN